MSGACRDLSKAMLWASEYSTESANWGRSSTPQPNPGYVQLCCVAIGLDGILSIVTSCADCGSCGSGRTIVTATWPGWPGPGRLRACSREGPFVGVPQAAPGVRATLPDGWPTASKVLGAQHAH